LVQIYDMRQVGGCIRIFRRYTYQRRLAAERER
jgi:hypothetical protein